jgi:hypothetical protein
METALIPTKVVGGFSNCSQKHRDMVNNNSVLDSKVMV